MGTFYRTAEGMPLYFRYSNKLLYEIDSRSESEFGQLVTYLTDISSKMVKIARCLDRVRADIESTNRDSSCTGL